MPLVSVLRGSDRCQTERKNRKARVLPGGSALALWYHVGTLPPDPSERIGKPASSFYAATFPPLFTFLVLLVAHAQKVQKVYFGFSSARTVPGFQGARILRHSLKANKIRLLRWSVLQKSEANRLISEAAHLIFLVSVAVSHPCPLQFLENTKALQFIENMPPFTPLLLQFIETKSRCPRLRVRLCFISFYSCFLRTLQ